MSNYAGKHGVTLVEMVIVIAVIVLLASLVIGIARRIDNQNKERALSHTFSLLDTALYEYREFKGFFPETLVVDDPNENSQILYSALNSIPASREILSKMSDSLLKDNYQGTELVPTPEIYDPWGTVLNYNYIAGDTFPKIISAGPNRKHEAGNGDDITNK